MKVRMQHGESSVVIDGDKATLECRKLIAAGPKRHPLAKAIHQWLSETDLALVDDETIKDELSQLIDDYGWSDSSGGNDADPSRRVRIATAMAQGLLAGDNAVLDSDGYDVSYRWSNDPSDLASSAVRLADALIAELDKGEL